MNNNYNQKSQLNHISLHDSELNALEHKSNTKNKQQDSLKNIKTT